jgi:hypothetical protein
MHASSAQHCALRIQATAARTDHVRHKRCLTIGHSQLHPLNLMPRHCVCLHPPNTYTRPSRQHLRNHTRTGSDNPTCTLRCSTRPAMDHGWFTTAHKLGGSIQGGSVPCGLDIEQHSSAGGQPTHVHSFTCGSLGHPHPCVEPSAAEVHSAITAQNSLRLLSICCPQV